MSDDNVVQFPGKKKDQLDAEQEELRKAGKELAAANTQRKVAIEGLQKRVRNLLENEKINASHMSPASVEAIRDATQALSMALTSIEAHDKLIDMITHDIVGVVQNIDQLSVHLFQTSAFTQTQLEILKSKGIVTHEEMKEMWTKLVKEKQKEEDGPTQE